VADRSFANLPEVQTLLSGELNAYDILVNDWVVFTDETLPPVARVYSAVEIDVVEDEDGNVVEIVETEVDVQVDNAGHVVEVTETEVDEILDADGDVIGVVETQVVIDVDADGEVTSVTETEVVELPDDAEGKQS